MNPPKENLLQRGTLRVGFLAQLSSEIKNVVMSGRRVDEVTEAQIKHLAASLAPKDVKAGDPVELVIRPGREDEVRIPLTLHGAKPLVNTFQPDLPL